MKIVHIADLGKYGRNGISEVLGNIVSAQRKQGEQVYFFNIRDNGKTKENEYDKVIPSYKLFKKEIGRIQPDVVIFHSVYYLIYYFFSYYLHKKNIPYLIQLHGGASGYAQSKKRLKKKISNVLFFNQFVKKSQGLIFLSEQEKEKAVVFKQLVPSIIIPNGCKLPKPFRHAYDENVLHFLFLARIDIYIKGLDILVEAINKIYNNIKGKAVFDFYGYTYDDKFQNLIAPYSDILHYHDAVYDDEKDKVLKDADVFLLTSRSEGMPMGVLEAMAYGLPCLVTEQTNMGDIVGEKAGWVVNCNSKEISNMILNIVNSPRSLLQRKSDNAKVAISSYTWDEIAIKSIKEYIRIISVSNF